MGGGEENLEVPVANSEQYSSAPEEEEEMDKDLMCPICMQEIKDAFLTSCGHSFCYMCIMTHLNNKNDCPCCSNFLTQNHLYPNFLLSKLLTKTSALKIAKNATPVEQLCQALQQGCKSSVKELDTLLSLISEKKQKMERDEAEINLQTLLDFMQGLKKKKIDELNELQTDLQFIKEDINVAERRRVDLHRRSDIYSAKLEMLNEDLSANRNITWRGDVTQGPSRMQSRKADERSSTSLLTLNKDTQSGSDGKNTTLLSARKSRVNAQFSDLQDCYLQKRRHGARQVAECDSYGLNRSGYSKGLEEFQSVLSTYTKYSHLKVVAELRHGDLFHSANIVSSIEFDRDDELFATAGVSRRIKIFDFSSVVSEPELQFPVAEISTRSKLSCLSWNKYTKNYISSSDYEGIVTVWDVSTRQSVMEYEEHEKRAWSVDFSPTDPSMLISGSDDCKVKVWSTSQESSVLNIDMKANICSVKYNPGSNLHIAVGSADHNIHYYDLRKPNQPLHVFSGHRKAVSYVKFLSSRELASASTDSTLRVWDVKENVPLRTFRGHTNEKNFVGLTVNSEYIACGSETNEVCVYHKAISKPAALHKFSSDVDETGEGLGSYFISAVCWKSNSPTMVAANSQGTIKVLVLAP